MKKFLWVALIACGFSIGNANQPLNLYTIDASTRGKDFSSILTTAFTLATTAGEVVIQTSGVPTNLQNSIPTGVIPFVQQGTLSLPTSKAIPYAAPNNTLFLFGYNPKGQSGLSIYTQYIVVGIEQIVTVAYRNTINPPFRFTNGVFNSLYSSNLLPLYTINPTLRAADIVDITQKFISFPSAFNGNSGSQVWILTTLTGPFYVPFALRVDPQAIPNVTAIQVLANEYLQITYYPQSSNFPWTVIVPAEQIQQIVFYPNQYPPS